MDQAVAPIPVLRFVKVRSSRIAILALDAARANLDPVRKARFNGERLSQS